MQVQTRESTKLHGLKVLVSVLGVLIAIGTAVVVGVVIKRIYASPPAPSITTMPSAALPAGGHIAGIAGAGGVFAVWVTGNGGGQVLLINPQTGAVSTVLK